MSSSNMYSSNMLFDSITEDLNASLATADELSREFNSLFVELSSTTGNSTQSTDSRSQNTTSSLSSGSGNTSSLSGGSGSTSSNSKSGGFGSTSSNSKSGGSESASSSSKSGGSGSTSFNSMTHGSGRTSSSSMSGGSGGTSSSSMSGRFGSTSSGLLSGDTYAMVGSGINYNSLKSGSSASLSSNSSKTNPGLYAGSVSGIATSPSNLSINPYATMSSVSSSTSRDGSGGTLTRGTMSIPQTSAQIRYSESSIRPPDSFYSGRNRSTSPVPQIQPLSSSQIQFSYPEQVYPGATLSPHTLSPHSQRRALPTVNRTHERTMSGSLPPSQISDQQSLPSTLYIATRPVYESSNSGRRSPRLDRAFSPGPFSQLVANTLPHKVMPSKPSDDTKASQRNPSKWNETDLDLSYERKPHHTYEKIQWIRPSIPISSWRESNLDLPNMPKKDPLPSHIPSVDGTLTRTNRISMPPDRPSTVHSPYSPQPIITRISIPPVSSGTRRHRPIPLSVIMRLQNPNYTAATHHPYITDDEVGAGIQRQPLPIIREFLSHHQPVTSEQQPEPGHYGEGPSASDLDAEVARINTLNKPSVPMDNPAKIAEQNKESKAEVTTVIQETEQPPRPLSPSRLQPVMAPEATLLPDIDELLRARAEVPRALKKRGSIDQSPGIQMSASQPNQYRQMIKKLFRRKGPQAKIETGTESSSSDEEESPTHPTATPPAFSTMPMTPQQKGLHSILRKAKPSNVKAQNPRARLVPLVLLLDGALVGELDTVQRAVQEMSDPSQPNDEGITALHNAICGGHYAVVEFLVRIGANVSAPDSHGWTPLHCAASCNDRALCEFLVRNGAAVLAVTESDGATAAQKCDPYAVGYEECESFLRGVEEAMGVENSGVLYALWSYSAQAPDELSFKEADMVTILQKPEGVDWWWASLCGHEGFVPNNYFGLFPKVRPKSLC